MAICGVISGTYGAVECAMESIQGQEKPWWNQGVAGCVAGLMMGSLRGRIDVACTTGAAIGIFFTGLGYGQYHQINQEKWKAEGNVLVCNVTEETFKEQYPEYKDI